MKKLLKGRGIIRRGDALSLGIFPSCGVANVTTVTFNYILVIVLLFPLNVGVSLYFHCTVLVPAYRVNNILPVSIILLLPVTGCYILPICMMQMLLLFSV